MRFTLLLVVLAFPFAPALAAQCAARSQAGTTALVELYTSEGCDSCPPADRWLSSLGARGYAPDRVVPIALHVAYWDYIGWKDPYARPPFAARQRKMAALARSAMVYTPQVLVQGRDFRGWNSRSFDDAVAKINARPSRARIGLALDDGAEGPLRVEARVELAAGVRPEDASLYLAAYENRLVSTVRAGENRGRTLTHDFVVFEWSGPIDFKGGNRLLEARSLPLLPQAVRKNSGVVAFVQDRKAGEVLQALMLPACPS